MDEERTLHKGNEGEKKKELTEVTKTDPVLTALVKDWELTKPVDIMMADRVVTMWRRIKEMEEKVEKQGCVVGIPPNIQPHPLISKINELHTSLLSYYKTFQKKLPEAGNKDFAEWIDSEGKGKKKKCK